MTVAVGHRSWTRETVLVRRYQSSTAEARCMDCRMEVQYHGEQAGTEIAGEVDMVVVVQH